jgi:imidazolonepropionase-like amidohydrolase
MRAKAWTVTIPAALLAVILVAPASADVVAFVGGTVHPVSGPPVEDGVLVIDGDTIVAVGPSGGVDVPAGARTVDVSGKHLYPGFVHPMTDLGLVEVDSVPGTDDRTELGPVNSDARVEVAFNADSFRLPPTVAGGVVYAHVVPRGDLVLGTSAVMRLDGWNWRDMTVSAPVGMHLRWPAYAGRGWRRQSPEELKKQREEALSTLNDVFDRAAAYAAATEAAPEPRLEALAPVIEGSLPLYIHATTLPQIEAALEWAAERSLESIVLVSGYDVARVADRLAAEDVPVILHTIHEIPDRDWEPYDAAFTAAATLHRAGVRFAIAAGGSDADSYNARNLPFEVATAVAYGLPREAALSAITLRSAEILGVADRVGSLEAGKEASFFVVDGDPLEILSSVEQVWIAGREQDRSEDHQWRLYRRYDRRPAPE